MSGPGWALAAALAVVPAAGTAASTAARPRVPVAVSSVTLTAPQHAWVLGTTACPSGSCTTVARTTDAGSSWRRVAPPPARLAPSGGQGVTELHFADDRDGWAFAPQLHVTHDGAATWHRLPVRRGSGQVVALTSAGGVAYAVVSSCVVGDPSACPAPARLWTSATGTDHWVRRPVVLPATGSPRLAAAGSTAYVVLVDPAVTRRGVLAVTTDSGGHWSSRPSPCDATTGERLLVAAATPTQAALLCSTATRPGYTSKRLFWTADTARTSGLRGTAPDVDLPQGLAVSGSAVLLAGVGGSSVLQRSPDQGHDWTTPFTADPATLADLALFGRTGAVVRGSGSAAGQLLMSHDQGRHWSTTTVAVQRAEDVL